VDLSIVSLSNTTSIVSDEVNEFVPQWAEQFQPANVLPLSGVAVSVTISPGW